MVPATRVVAGVPLVALLAVPIAVGTGSGIAQNESQKAPAETLSPGARLERRLAPGQVDSYQIHLPAGEFVHLLVEQREMDLVLEWRSPAGSDPQRIEAQTGAFPSEEVVAIADVPGLHTLRVRAAAADRAGRYGVRVAALRPASDADRSHTAAERHYQQGERLAKGRRPEDWQSARGDFEAALTLYRQVGRRDGEAKTLYRIGHAQIYARLYRDAEDALQRALVIAREQSAPGVIAAIQTARAYAFVAQGNLPAALAAATESAALFEERGNREWAANSLNTIGIVHRRMGDAERAIEHQLRALDLARAAGATAIERDTLNNLGLGYRDLGDYRTSLSFYEQALARVRGLDEPAREAGLLNNLGNLHRVLGQHAEAIEKHTRALALAQRADDQGNVGRALNTLGLAYYELGKYAEALEHHELARQIRREIRDLPGEASTLDGAGMAWYRLGNTDKAIENLTEALRIRRALGEQHSEADTLVHLALVERGRGNLEAALDHIAASVERTDSLRSRVFSPDLRASFVAAAQEQYELQVDVLMELHRARPDGGFARRGLEASDRARARVLLEALLESRTDIRQGIDPALLEQERAVRRRLDDASARVSRLLSRDSAAEEIEAARADMARVNVEGRQVQARIRQESPAYAALAHPQPISTEEIQRRLIDAETLLLEYALGENRSWLWVVTPAAVEAFQLPPRQEIERAARRTYELLTARQPRANESVSARATRVTAADADWRRESVALGRLLLGPAVARLAAGWRGKRLLVVAPDVLQYVPFAALGDPAADGQPLAFDHEIVALPSASVLAAIRRESGRRMPPARQLAVLADPVFDVADPRVGSVRVGRRGAAAAAGRPAAFARALRSAEASGTTPLTRLSRLPFSREEARAIAAFVPADERLEATDFAASRATATSGGLADYRFVHFATHGVLNTEQPELSGLVLSLVDRDGRAQDGFLRLGDIYNLRLPAEVVVLSACQTALGKAIRGEGLVGLTRGFMYAGARRVVASLWQVDDMATAELMRRFYRGMLTEGLRPAAALRAAQRELARDPRWASPFYWSGFVLQGEWK